jgi:hypothetical protein
MVAFENVAISIIFSKLGYFSIEDSFIFFSESQIFIYPLPTEIVSETPKAPYGCLAVHADMTINIKRFRVLF